MLTVLRNERSLRVILFLIIENLRRVNEVRFDSTSTWIPKTLIDEDTRETDLRVAITAHIFYEDYIAKLIRQLKNLEHSYSLLITTPSRIIAEKLHREVSNLNNCKDLQIAISQNRGRNFGPLLVEYGNVLLNDYDIFLHIHSKKSLHGKHPQEKWASYLYQNLLGNKRTSRKIINAFHKDSTIGLIYPVTYPLMPSWVHSWLQNYSLGQQLAKRIGVEPFVSDFHIYPVGGMFWARTSSLRQLLSYSWSYEDFPEELGQIDGTTQHAIERLLDVVSNYNGFSSAFIFNGEITDDRSFAWKDSIDLTPELLREHLKKYSVISWDLFDTLIFRTTGQPDFAKFQVGNMLVQRKLIPNAINYVEIRNATEAVMRRSLGRYTDLSLSEITKQIVKNQNWNITPEEIENAEFDFDKETFRIRHDVYELYTENIHKSYVISDSYYTTIQLEEIFRELGMQLPRRILSSATTGRRKDRGDIWPHILDKYAKSIGRYIHLGDNSVSDNQIPGDFGIHTKKIYSAKEHLEILTDEKLPPLSLESYIGSPISREISQLNQGFLQFAFIFRS